MAPPALDVSVRCGHLNGCCPTWSRAAAHHQTDVALQTRVKAAPRAAVSAGVASPAAAAIAHRTLLGAARSRRTRGRRSGRLPRRAQFDTSLWAHCLPAATAHHNNAYALRICSNAYTGAHSQHCMQRHTACHACSAARTAFGFGLSRSTPRTSRRLSWETAAATPAGSPHRPSALVPARRQAAPACTHGTRTVVHRW